MKSAKQYDYLVEALWGGHRSLDGQAAHVLPAFLQERDKGVDGQHHVGDQLILGHVTAADSDTSVLVTIDLRFVRVNALPPRQPKALRTLWPWYLRQAYHLVAFRRGMTGSRIVPENGLARWGS